MRQIIHAARRMCIAVAFVATAGVPLRAQSLPTDVCFEQAQPTTTVRWRLRDAVQTQLERSYITAAQGFSNLPPMVFEGNVSAHFVAREMSRAVIVASMQDVVRMLAVESAPVRTPSYSPQLAIYVRSARCNLPYLKLAHHSNGQEGPAFIGGEVNLKSGNFSTNYIDIGYARVYPALNQYITWQIGSELHFYQDDSVRVHYGRLRPHVRWAMSYAQPRSKLLANGALFQFDATILPDSRKFYGLRSGTVSALLMWQPPVSEDFGIMVRGVVGRDYYNLWYERPTLRALQVGIIGSARSVIFPR